MTKVCDAFILTSLIWLPTKSKITHPRPRSQHVVTAFCGNWQFAATLHALLQASRCKLHRKNWWTALVISMSHSPKCTLCKYIQIFYVWYIFQKSESSSKPPRVPEFGQMQCMSLQVHSPPPTEMEKEERSLTPWQPLTERGLLTDGRSVVGRGFLLSSW